MSIYQYDQKFENIQATTNNIKKAKFSLDGLPGLLTAYNIEIR